MEQKTNTQKKEMRFSEEELSLLRTTFDDDTLKSLRGFLWGIEQPKAAFRRKEVASLIGKFFLPQPDPKAPVSQVVDLWLTLTVSDKNAEDAHPFLLARDILVSHFENRMAALHGKEEGKAFDLMARPFTSPHDEAYVNQIARSEIFAHVEQQLRQIKALFGLSPEELEMRLQAAAANSSE